MARSLDWFVPECGRFGDVGLVVGPACSFPHDRDSAGGDGRADSTPMSP